MPSNTITLALTGDVPLDVFADEMQHWSGLIRALSSELDPAANIEWVIVDLQPGSAQLTARGEAHEPDAVERVVRAYATVGRALEQGGQIPFSPQVRRHAQAIVRHLNDKVTAIRFETPEDDFTIMAQASSQARPAYLQAYGTVTGKVQTLSSRRRLSFTLYDALFDKAVNCYLKEGQEDLVRDKWDRYAIVEGRVSRDPMTGRPVAVRDITDVQLLPIIGHGDYREARGVIPWSDDGEKPEEVIRRLRDDW